MTEEMKAKAELLLEQEIPLKSYQGSGNLRFLNAEMREIARVAFTNGFTAAYQLARKEAFREAAEHFDIEAGMQDFHSGRNNAVYKELLAAMRWCEEKAKDTKA